MNNQGRAINLLQVVCVIDFRELMDAVILPLNTALQADSAEVFPQPVIGGDMVTVEAIERNRQVEVKL